MKLGSWLGACVALLTGVAAVAAQDPLARVAALPPGPHLAACSNVAQDFSRLMGETAESFWEGTPHEGQYRYLSLLLSEASSSLRFTITPPATELFPRFHGNAVEYVALFCYPTAATNTRPDYPLPNGRAVPRMERAGEAPIWAGAGARYPLLVYSHGLGGSPLSDEYLGSITRFVSHGYAVLAMFHGDPRFSRVRLEDLGDYFYAVRNFNEIVEMQAVRPLSVVAGLDMLLADARYGDHLDPARIGIFGTSLGGETALLTVGAKLTASLGLSAQTVVQDPRIKAITGYVPYSGQSFLPAFGDNQSGVDGLGVPYLGIGGTADFTAPIGLTEQAVNRLSGSRFLVAFQGVGHRYDASLVPDIFTWTINFFDGFLKDDAAAKVRLARLEEVLEGPNDGTRIDYLAPTAPSGAEALVPEFYHPGLKHFFLTASVAEAAGIDGGAAGAGWQRTGLAFKALNLGAPLAAPVCRFYGTPGLGPNSHFYTAHAGECGFVKTVPSWFYEGLAFAVEVPADGVCPANRVPVYRAYNNGFPQNDSNHRYTTSRSSYAASLGANWVAEGLVFCAMP
ncbi:MAG: hypothetical protein HYZ17_10900 [Betaproteobacteria bacterium]|nr:hypothetical protein [Betaproteobacteria bacterium]